MRGVFSKAGSKAAAGEGCAVTRCRYHCRPCGGHFSSLEAFDGHRSGPLDARRCSYPDDADLVERPGGTCTIADPGCSIGEITIYSTERAERARERFTTRAERQAAGAKLSGGGR